MFISIIFHELLFENGCNNPPDRSIYLKFRHNVSRRHKREVRNFGESRWKGPRVLAGQSDGTSQTPPPPLPVGNRVSLDWSENIEVWAGYLGDSVNGKTEVLRFCWKQWDQVYQNQITRSKVIISDFPPFGEIWWILKNLLNVQPIYHKIRGSHGNLLRFADGEHIEM